MEKRIIFATGNEGKMREIRMILGDLGVPVVSMKEAGAAADIEENGTSFEENAIIKARTIMKKTGEITMADDSGLEIDALGGEPGIYSARYMGEDTSYDIKNQNLIDRLEGIPEDWKRNHSFRLPYAAGRSQDSGSHARLFLNRQGGSDGTGISGAC